MREWSTPGFRADAQDWVDARLAAAGTARTGPLTQPRVRPWGTVLTAPTTAGPVWLKAPSPATVFEVPLYALLVRVVPDRVLHPIAADPDRGWVLLPDGGPAVGDPGTGSAALEAALPHYGRMQRALAPHADELRALGVLDASPAALPERFAEALDAVVPVADADLLRRLRALAPEVARWSAELAAAPGDPTLDHNDLHAANVLAGARFVDWGDAVLAHPFASMLVPMDVAEHVDGPTAAHRVRDAYLDAFTDLAPRAELVAAVDAARRLARVARALVWHRAVHAGEEPPEDDLAAAPLHTLTALLDEPG